MKERPCRCGSCQECNWARSHEHELQAIEQNETTTNDILWLIDDLVDAAAGESYSVYGDTQYLNEARTKLVEAIDRLRSDAYSQGVGWGEDRHWR